MKAFIIASFYSFLITSASAQIGQQLPVGFKSYHEKDISRTYYRQSTDGSFIAGSRPVTLHVWYPTSESKGTIVSFTDLVVLNNDLERSLSSYTSEERKSILKKYLERQIERGRDSLKVVAELEFRTKSKLDAKPAHGKFPVVIFSPSMLGGGTSNFRYCEYLASQGYIVVSHSSFGLAKNLMDTGDEGVAHQKLDIQYAAQWLRNSGVFDVGEIGLAGHSWGGLASILVANESNEIKAVLSLEGSEEFWMDRILSNPSFDVTNFDVPYLRMIHSQSDTFGFFHAMKFTERYLLHINDSTFDHFDFIATFPIENALKESYFQSICEYSVTFFNYYVGPHIGNAPLSFSGNFRNGAVHHYVKESSLSKSEILSLLQRGKLSDVKQEIQTIRTHNTHAYSEQYLVQIGEVLLWAGQYPHEARDFLEYVTELFPNSDRAYEMLGNLHSWLLVDPKLSLQFYERALLLNPTNERLKLYVTQQKKLSL